MSVLLDLLFALVLVGATLAVALPQIVGLMMQPAQNDAANQLALMQAAGASYIKNHFNSLIGAIPVGLSQAVTPGALIADGDLPATFNDTNIFGQNHVLVVAQPSAAVLEGMVFTYGGDTIPDITAIRVAQAGPANAMVILASNSGNFEGAAGGQTVPIASFSNAGYAISPGHLAAHIVPAQYAAEAPFLNRYFTGTSDDNVMHTDLSMNGNNITAAKTVSASQQVTTPMIVDPASPAYQITMAGSSNINNLTATGAISSADFLHLSDARLKQSVTPIDDPIDIIRRLQGHRFIWRDKGKADVGFIAQEVAQVMPEAVEQTAHGWMAVRYDILAAPLVEAFKRQNLQIEQQFEMIRRLQDRIDQSRSADPSRLPSR
jgi:hypothetical protein